jgi:acetyl-CoA carboxylase biotin carboxyl carrier protein
MQALPKPILLREGLTGVWRQCDDARRFLLKAKEACLDLKEIKTLIDLMRKNDLSVFKMEKEGFKITLKKGSDFQPIITTQVPGPIPAGTLAPAGATLPGSSTTQTTPTAETESLKEITSPMVGTFYEAPSPESAPYVQVGQEVTEDSVVCIIEAMKVMNEIKAEVRGVIAEILAENGKPVQFGQPLFKIR